MDGGGANRVVAGALYQLLQTALSYVDAMREVRPKRERIEYSEQELDSQIKVLAKINEDTATLSAELLRYQAMHTDAIAEKQILNEMLEQAENRVVMKDFIQITRRMHWELFLFKFLISPIVVPQPTQPFISTHTQATSQQLMQRFEERDLWQEQLDSLEKCSPLIPGDCLLGAAFLGYCGPFPQSMRPRLVQLEDINRRGVPHSGPFDVKTLLGDERQINWYV